MAEVREQMNEQPLQECHATLPQLAEQDSSAIRPTPEMCINSFRKTTAYIAPMIQMTPVHDHA